MASDVVYTSIAGIVVSGVVGPAVTSWNARRAARKQFLRDQGSKRRDDLRTLLDEAARVLGVGLIRLREIRAAERSERNSDKDPHDWADEVFVLGQRLRLRLGAAAPAVTTYTEARSALVDAGQVAEHDEDESYMSAVRLFEDKRDVFLAAARAKLEEPISDKEP